MSKLHPKLKYAYLEELGLANIEALLDVIWKLQWQTVKGAPNEIEILASWRGDRSFGSCRFNIADGVGADFAEQALTKRHVQLALGPQFGLEDIDRPVGRNNSPYFHLIGLVQRIYGCDYRTAAAKLANDLKALGENLIQVSVDAALKRQKRVLEAKREREKKALGLWSDPRSYRYKGTLGEQYLQRRGIILSNVEQDIKFASRTWCAETSTFEPALLFAIRPTPQGDLKGTHRIFLDGGGNKANLDNPKMALGSVKGNGIWFGKPGECLCVAEGPETALSLLVLGYKFVCCAISAYNLGGLDLSKLCNEVPQLNEIIVCGDNDPVGRDQAYEAANKYNEHPKLAVKLMFPADKFKDFNDELMLKV